MFSISLVFAYLLGSIPTGFLVAKSKGIDIRKVGSGNIGATNAFRVLGKQAGTLVLMVDALKGFVGCRYVPVIGLALSPDPGQWSVAGREYWAMAAGLATILGHNYSCWLRGKGGKGIATSAGVLLALVPQAGFLVLAMWALVVAATRYVSLGSIAAAVFLPAAIWLCHGSIRLILLGVVLGGLAVYKHRSNVQRLMKGTENRIGAGKGAHG